MSEGCGAARDTQGNLKSRQNTAEPGCCWGPALCGGFLSGAPALLPVLGLLAGSPKAQERHFIKITPPPLSSSYSQEGRKQNKSQPPQNQNNKPNKTFLQPRGQSLLLGRRSLLPPRVAQPLRGCGVGSCGRAVTNGAATAAPDRHGGQLSQCDERASARMYCTANYCPFSTGF